MALPPYTPDPTDASMPSDFVMAGYAAAEIRALKGRTNSIDLALQAETSARNTAIAGEASARAADVSDLLEKIEDEEDAREAGDNAVLAVVNSIPLPSTVRQTVLSAPLDVSGLPDFLQAGAGLSVTLKGVGPAVPLILSIGAGFSPTTGAARDVRVVLDSAASGWTGLANNTTNYLYVELDPDTEAVSFFSSIVAPDYGILRPIGLTANQFFYDTRHLAPAQVWTGSAWQTKFCICVGEAVTSAGAVSSTLCYALQGMAQGSISGFDSENLFDIEMPHNIGAPHTTQLSVLCTTSYSGGLGNPAFTSEVGAEYAIPHYTQDSDQLAQGATATSTGLTVSRLTDRFRQRATAGKRMTFLSVRLVGDLQYTTKRSF